MMTIFVSEVRAASFNCKEAKRPIEKFICSSPELNSADTRMGEVYKKANNYFPLKGYLSLTQRLFIAQYPSCLIDKNGNAATSEVATRQCVNTVYERINEIEMLSNARVYTNAKQRFAPDDLVIIIYTIKGKYRIKLWGNWMPDAYAPKPFPYGKICDIDSDLTPIPGGFKSDMTENAIFNPGEDSVNVSAFITCTPRNGIGAGDYVRVR